MATATAMTVEEFAQLQTADTEAYELVEGELVPLSSATPRHAWIRSEAEIAIKAFLKSTRLGAAVAEVDCLLGPRTIRRPDLSLFLTAKWNQIDLDKVPFPFAPDIAVEVISPSESAEAVRLKTRDYLAAGCREVWEIFPASQEMLIWSAAGVRVLPQDALIETPVLPGFTARLSDWLTLATTA